MRSQLEDLQSDPTLTRAGRAVPQQTSLGLVRAVGETGALWRPSQHLSHAARLQPGLQLEPISPWRVYLPFQMEMLMDAVSSL